MTLADDSGLEIDALDGRPGIYSARYTEGTDSDRYNKVLEEMKNIEQKKRTARFTSVVAIYNPKTKNTHTFYGSCEGWIQFEPKGTQGFGYDPIFFSVDLNTSFGEASDQEKNKVSHRGRALQKFKKFLSHEV